MVRRTSLTAKSGLSFAVIHHKKPQMLHDTSKPWHFNEPPTLEGGFFESRVFRADMIRCPSPLNCLDEPLIDLGMFSDFIVSRGNLDELGGRAAEYRNSGFTLSFQRAIEFGVEYNGACTDYTWQPVVDSTIFIVVARLPGEL